MSCCGSELTKNDAGFEPSNTESPAKSQSHRHDLIMLVIAGFIAGNSTLATLVCNLSEIPSDVRGYVQLGLLGSTLVVAGLLAPQLFRNVNANVRRRMLSVDLLFLLGCCGAMGYSLLNFLRGTGAVYFEVFSILLVIYCLGGWIKRSTQYRVWTSLDAWSPAKHRCRVVQPDGRWDLRVIAEVRRGDSVQVPVGAMVPVDGEVVEGAAFVRESTITGEPHVRPVEVGDSLFASSIVVDSPLVIRATAGGSERLIDRITAVVDAETRSPSRWQTQADRIARFFTPLVASVALLALAFWAWRGDVSTAVLVSLSVLLVACPCAFGFATPVSIWVTLSRLAASSLVVAKADVIERLAAIDTVVFDKTGTLTVVQLELICVLVRAESRYSRDELLSLVSSVESHSQHPIANVLLSRDYAQLPVESTAAIPAVGVRGRVKLDGEWRSVEVGRLSQLHRPCCDGELLDRVERTVEAGQQAIAIRVDGDLQAAAIIGEASIDTLEEGIAQLMSLGLTVKVFSGDAGERVQNLGITASIGGLSPDEKATKIADLRRQGHRVLFVGDGVNDAAAMSKADASIAVAEGAAIAVELADCVWHGRDLRNLSSAIEITRRSVVRLRRALLFALVYNTIGMSIAAAGWLHPVVAVVLMLVSSLTVVLHAADMSWEREHCDLGVPIRTQDGPASSQLPLDRNQIAPERATPTVVQIGGMKERVG